MDEISGPLRECANCGRTFNKVVNRRCPECETEVQRDSSLVSQ